MKKNIIISIGLLLSGFSYSQVGINTANPQGIFNIDGGKDNPTTGSAHTNAQQLNDFTVTAAGNVGIGKIAPSTKLHITTGGTAATPNATGFRLEDGNQNTNYVLTSDTNGVGTWKPVVVQRIVGTLGAGIDIPFNNGSKFLRTLSSIALPPGKWEVSVTMILPVTLGTMTVNDWLWMKTTFSELNQATINDGQQTPDFVGASLASGLFSGPKGVGVEKYDMLFGTLIINNTSAATKTYYYYAGFLDSVEYTTGSGKSTKFSLYGGNAWAENTITAVRIQ